MGTLRDLSDPLATAAWSPTSAGAAGLRTGLRGPLRICAFAALLTLLVPVVVAGG